MTLTFVVSQLTIPIAGESRATPAAGFNLDGRDSGDGVEDGDCQAAGVDYASSAWDPEHTGVDNALQHFVASVEAVLEEGPGSLDARIAEVLATGRSAILIELSEVDDLTHDPSVTVSFREADIVGEPSLDAEGRLAAGQAFSAGRLIADPAVGDIFEGRLRVRLPSLALPDWEALGDARLAWPTPASDVELRFDVSDGRLRRGNLGGAARVERFQETFRDVFGGIEPAAATGQFADLDPRADRPERCSRFSFGFLLEAVSASQAVGD